MGERTPVACDDAAAAARLAIAEAITNIMAADVQAIGDIKLSANWMAAAGHPGQDAALFDAVTAVGLELCPALGIAVPVGKDSLSMKTTWHDGTGAGVQRAGRQRARPVGCRRPGRVCRHDDRAERRRVGARLPRPLGWRRARKRCGDDVRGTTRRRSAGAGRRRRRDRVAVRGGPRRGAAGGARARRRCRGRTG